MRFRSPILLLLTCTGAASAGAQRSAQTVDRLLVVTLDGMRWQEVFGGADRELIAGKAGGVSDTAGLLRRFWRDSPEARREALMPFLWGTMVRGGWLLGDSAQGNEVRVTNGKRFSYPGYNELLTGAPDDRIDSNDKIPNPNLSVFEWLDHRPEFRGRVAAYGSWDVLPFILNTARSGLPANGNGPPIVHPRTEAERTMNALAADIPPYWGSVRFDAVTTQGALSFLRARRPRVLYVMLGDTDEWAHERRYDLYLDAAWKADRFLRTLWETVQSLPGYRNRTALLIATDHGRGAGDDWTDHGRKVPAAERIWMAGMAPGTPPTVNDQRSGGSRGAYTQSQFAATIAALLGLEAEFRTANPKAAPAIEFCCRSGK